MHEDLFEELQEIIINGDPDNLAVAAPRGNAKSTLVSLALPIWCAIYEYKHYIVLVSDTADQANDFIGNIKTELEDNDRLIEDFGSQEGMVWTNSDIILANDVRIQGLGAGKKIRGRKYKQYRPDLIIGDDLENDENIENADQRKKMKSWQAKALSKAGDERTDKVFIGTIMHYDSLLAGLLKNPIYKTLRYQAVISWSPSPLWVEWEKIVTDLANIKRMEDAFSFYKAHEEEMLKGTKVLWPGKEPYYALMLQRIADGPAAFSSEKQNEPLSEEERRFSRNWIQYYEESDIVGKDLIVVGYLDPSMGKLKGDFSAIITLGMDTESQVYVLDADIQRRHPDQIVIDTIVKHQVYRYSVFGVEIIQFQEYFKDTLTNKLKEYNELKGVTISMPIKGVRTHTDKILRIQSLQPDIKNGRIKFKRDQVTLIEQLVNFPSADNDDGPDALEGAMGLYTNRSAVGDYYKQQAHEALRHTPTSFIQNIGIPGLIR